MNWLTTSISGTIGAQISSFLSSAIEHTKPRWIVPVERKGTALLRTYAESYLASRSDESIWKRVLSSETLRSCPPSIFRKGIILIVDDSVHNGKRISDTRKILIEEKNVDPERVKSAVFGVHEHSYSAPIDFRWSGQINDDTYPKVREELIQFFQRKGSLLLDTEHIEVPVEVKCGRLEFFDALCRAGLGVEYLSTGGRLNLTIHNPFLVNEHDLISLLPAKSTIKNVVRKIRVVERSNDRYAIIPIFFPSIKSDTNADELSGIDDCLSELAAGPDINFHLVGIYAALYLFQTVFMCLRDLIGSQKVNVRIPHPGDTDDSLSHLQALFPDLNVEKLHTLVEHFIEDGRMRKARKRDVLKPCRIEATPGARYEKRLKELQWLILKEVRRLPDDLPSGPIGASIMELMRLAEGTSQEEKTIEKALLSAALDVAIDEADLIPDINEMPFSDGEKRFVRTFRIDSEMVLSDIRRLTAIWRSSSPPPNSYAEYNREP